MRVQCPNCGGPHPKWECKKPPKTEAEKVQDDFVAFGTSVSIMDEKGEVKHVPLENFIPAGESPIRKSGAKFDKTAYMREYMRRRRGGLKRKPKAEKTKT